MAYQKSNKLHIVAVTAMIRDGDGRYLVLKRGEHEVAYPGMYIFPGGKVEDNETVDEALANEIEEETGLKMKPGKILVKDGTFVRPDGQSVKVFSYLVEVEKTEPVTLSDDHTDYRWLDPADLDTIEHPGYTDEFKRAEAIVDSGVDLAVLRSTSFKTEE
jgi:8-oxo-dGTP pyrophosphatase MutT (NUDIX family)